MHPLNKRGPMNYGILKRKTVRLTEIKLSNEQNLEEILESSFYILRNTQRWGMVRIGTDSIIM